MAEDKEVKSEAPDSGISGGEITLYQSRDGEAKLDVRLEQETVWLSQAQMAGLFERERSVITKRINNVFREGELEGKSNVQILHIADSDKPVKFFSLDVIVSVGYRVKSAAPALLVEESQRADYGTIRGAQASSGFSPRIAQENE